MTAHAGPPFPIGLGHGSADPAPPTAAGSPECRADKVAETRRRLAGGYYHAVLVRAKVAREIDRVLRGLERI